MANLTAEAERHVQGGSHVRLPLVDAETPYRGSLLGYAAASDTCRILQQGDRLAGICTQTVPEAGAADDEVVANAVEGIFKIRVPTIAGASGASDIDDAVYASDGNTYTKTSTSNTRLGTITGYRDGLFEITVVTAHVREALT
jgi:hypothetical protein